MMGQIYIGVDVAKAWLDIYHPGQGARPIENTPARICRFAGKPGAVHIDA